MESINKRQRIPKGQSEIQRNWQYSTQEEEKRNKNTMRYVYDTTMRKQTQIT